jgi:hypothetical protein
LEDAFAHGKWARATACLNEYKDEIRITTKLVEFEKEELVKERLFVGDRLWLIYFIFKAFYFRLALLVNRSFKESRYNGWRDDDVIRHHLATLFDAQQSKGVQQ